MTHPTDGQHPALSQDTTDAELDDAMTETPELYGPTQFRLNQGTAKKWRALLANPPWQNDEAQLSYQGPNGIRWGSGAGLLASVAEPTPSVAWDGVSDLYDYEQFFISNGLRSRLKLRGTLPEFTSFRDALYHLDQMAAHHGLEIRK